MDVRHFEADWAVFFLNREHDDFTLAHPPPSINPANCSPYKFFSHPSFLELARTTSSRPAFPIHLLHSSSALREASSSPFLSSPFLSSPFWKKSTRPGFQTADLFFHVAIYFFTPACTG